MAEFIDGTRDANRARAPRLDLVFYMDDGSYWCLHHGDIKKIDAKPVFQSVPAIACTAEQISARDQWSSIDVYICIYN